MRKTLFALHSYFSLIALIPIMIVSLTGSILVFKTEIDQWLMPNVAALDHADKLKNGNVERTNHNLLQKTIEQRFPDYILGSWEMFYDGKEADRVYLIKKGTDEWYKVYFDPFKNAILSEPVSLTSKLTDWLLHLHYTFLLNGIGGEDAHWGTFLGLVVALILTFLGVSGLIIHRKFWLQLFRLRLTKALRVVIGDIHRIIGAWASPVILILGVTGFYFNAIDYYHEVFEHAEEQHYKPHGPLYDQSIDMQLLINDSQKKLSNFTPTYLLYPYEPEVNITVFGAQPGVNPFASNYASTVTYDKKTGSLLAANEGRSAPFVTQVFDSFRELHFGSFAGIVSKIVWCGLGLAPFWLALTGLTLWFMRREKQRSKMPNTSAMLSAQKPLP